MPGFVLGPREGPAYGFHGAHVERIPLLSCSLCQAGTCERTAPADPAGTTVTFSRTGVMGG